MGALQGWLPTAAAFKLICWQMSQSSVTHEHRRHMLPSIFARQLEKEHPEHTLLLPLLPLLLLRPGLTRRCSPLV
jgi:hypothetical protein